MQIAKKQKFQNILFKKILTTSIADNFYSFAIIGSGPAAFMTAKVLQKKFQDDCSIHMFEKQFSPFGLLRYGVAPDHIPIKNVQNELAEVAEQDNFYFYGNVEIGKDVKIEEIKDKFSGIIYAYGAETDKKLNIKGEREYEQTQVFGAQTIVKWYNKHPDFRNFKLQLSKIKNVAIIGNGNVAIDIARILSKNTQELEQTEISENCLEQLKQSSISNIHIIGRRGVVQSAFNLKEIRQFARVDGVKLYMWEKDFDLNEASKQESTLIKGNFDATLRGNSRKLEFLKKSMNLIKDEENYQQILKDDSHKKIIFNFCQGPVEIQKENDQQKQQVDQLILKLQNMKLEGEAFKQTCSPIENSFMNLKTDLIIRSIGYKSQNINQNLNWNQKSNILVTDPDTGTLIDIQNQLTSNEFAAGWIKTGPLGVLESTYQSSIDSCTKLFEKIDKNEIEEKEDPHDDLLDYLPKRYTSWETWKLLDEWEINEGKKVNKIRSKIDNQEQVDKILYEIYPWTCNKA
ncbi:hypothetical protein PPERSA_08069 [Pseudocohnilembus persalinus]|uniref:NADPH:adrenodoxin oxidoreductase, mitochondrial n=1 Tax=Pseudocohnilembus persalinus TaxID=266149 RepID=A0A0V0R2M0_PSEPJ|nr:hypothetical protein PPERSA_08069 [Pseudocohnilembus persalinus]|eukprot:KRX08758.1 hypothetical protein PPERSA_08069 [Pseudocohnilembus persalinus]